MDSTTNPATDVNAKSSSTSSRRGNHGNRPLTKPLASISSPLKETSSNQAQVIDAPPDEDKTVGSHVKKSLSLGTLPPEEVQGTSLRKRRMLTHSAQSVEGISLDQTAIEVTSIPLANPLGVLDKDLQDCPVVSDPQIIEPSALPPPATSEVIVFPSSGLIIPPIFKPDSQSTLSSQVNNLIIPASTSSNLSRGWSAINVFKKGVFGSDPPVPFFTSFDTPVSTTFFPPGTLPMTGGVLDLFASPCPDKDENTGPCNATNSLTSLPAEDIPPSNPSTIDVIEVNNEAPHPTLASFAKTIFEAPVVSSTTSLPVVLSLPAKKASDSFDSYREFSDEDGFEQVRQALLRSVGWVDELALRNTKYHQSLLDKELDFGSMMQSMETARSEYQLLLERCQILSHQCAESTATQEALSFQNEEFCKQKTSLTDRITEIESEKVKLISDNALLDQTNKELQQENEGLKTSFTKKVSELELLCAEKDVSVKVMGEKLKKKSDECSEFQTRCSHLSETNAAYESKAVAQADLANFRETELGWLLRTGIPSLFQHLLRSDEFGQQNGYVQSACLEFGLHRGCAEMKKHNSERLEGVSPLHSFPDAGQRVMARFSEMVNFKYPLLQVLESGSFGMEDVKRLVVKMDDSGVLGAPSSS